MRSWQDSKYMPLWSTLPKQFRLSDDFWEKVMQIHRYTEQDGKEHAISVWSIYKQIIITEITRGSESAVTTNDHIQVKFEAIKGKQAFTRFLYVNDKERERATIPFEKMPRNPKEAEMRYLFNVHTHPPHRVSNMIESKTYYSYFSQTDINSLLTTTAVVTGLVTDKITFLFKTRNTPKEHGLGVGVHPDEAYIRDILRIAEYEADFQDKIFILKEVPGAMESQDQPVV
jgi:hypothetical protein